MAQRNMPSSARPGQGKMRLKPCSLTQDLSEVSFEQLTNASSSRKSSLINWMKGLQYPPAKRLEKIRDSPDSVRHHLCLPSPPNPGKRQTQPPQGWMLPEEPGLTSLWGKPGMFLAQQMGLQGLP